MGGRARYRHIDAALLRASTSTADVGAPRWPSPDAGDGHDADLDWIGAVWASTGVADAVSMASPVLASRIEAAIDGAHVDSAQVRRIVMSLARYLVRMRGRATPFGLFAGVAPLRFGMPSTSLLIAGQRPLVRADCGWLAAVIARLESCPCLVHRLQVVVNDLVVVRADRIFVPWQPHAGNPERPQPVEVSLRHTPPVALMLQAARSPIPVAILIDKLAAQFPRAAASTVDALVTELITRGVLITNLRPPLTTVDALGHLVGVLRDVEPAAAPQVTPLIGELQAIHARIAADGDQPSLVQRRDRAVLATRMRSLVTASVQALAVDVRLDCAPVLPPSVAAEAAAATGALLRLSAAATGMPAWREYHARFLQRYGVGALVTVKDLVDPATGLGFPHHDAAGDSTALSRWSRRDERLLALAQLAALDGAQEVELDDDAIDALTDGEPDGVRVAPHLDLSVEVRAATPAALDAGDFTLVVTGLGRTAMATSGRFLELLPEDDRRQITGLYATLPTAVEGALPAQVSFPPHRPRAENVTRVPQVLAAVIPVAEHRQGGEDRIPVDDLAFTADLDRMFVVSLSRRRVVEPVLTCAAAWHTMPPLARLLVQVPHATSAPVALFDWGAAACLPFRPRLRYGRTVLTPARWLIPAATLPGPAATHTAWVSAMATLRQRLRLPARVFVGTADRRLRLHLDAPMDLALLRAHVDQTSGPVTVTEAPTIADHGWCDGRAHEVVIAMVSTAPPARPPAVLARPGPLPVISRDHGHLPGSSVLYAKLYGPADAVDTILTEHLPAWVHGSDEPLWWFVRYRDPAPHLRIRVRTSDYGYDATRLGAWAGDLRRHGLAGDLTLTTYRPETARYGAGAAIPAAEALFAADSAAATAQLAATTRRQVAPDALTAVSLLDLLSDLLGGRSLAVGWLIEHPDLAGRTVIRDRAVLKQAITLAGVEAGEAQLAGIPGGPRIAAAWQRRRAAATAYARCLTAQAAGVTPASVAVSLLHLHHNRARGADLGAEARTHHLARAIALAHTARRTPAKDRS